MGRPNQYAPSPSGSSPAGHNAEFDIESKAIQIDNQKTNIVDDLRSLVKRGFRVTFKGSSCIEESIEKLEKVFQAEEFLKPLYRLRNEFSEMGQVEGNDEFVRFIQNTLNSSCDSIKNLLRQLKCLLRENDLDVHSLTDFLSSVSNVVENLQDCTNMSATLSKKLIEMRKEMGEKEKEFKMKKDRIRERYKRLISEKVRENDELKKVNQRLQEDRDEDVQLISIILTENQSLAFENTELKKEVERIQEEAQNLKNERLISRKIRLASLLSSLLTCWGALSHFS